jgi:hypothetical protein
VAGAGAGASERPRSSRELLTRGAPNTLRLVDEETFLEYHRRRREIARLLPSLVDLDSAEITAGVRAAALRALRDEIRDKFITGPAIYAVPVNVESRLPGTSQ